MSREQRKEILEVGLKRSRFFIGNPVKIMSVFQFQIFNGLAQFCVIFRGSLIYLELTRVK